jgi:metal-responsive CopG/Arc/MetJ family transcriptional regulator
MVTFSITMDEKSFEKMSKKVERIAMRKNSNRSAVLRDVIFEGLGINEQNKRPRNYTRSMSIKAE